MIYSGDIDHNDIADVWNNYDEYEAVKRVKIGEVMGVNRKGEKQPETDGSDAAKYKRMAKGLEEDEEEYLAKKDAALFFLIPRFILASSSTSKVPVDNTSLSTQPFTNFCACSKVGSSSAFFILLNIFYLSFFIYNKKFKKQSKQYFKVVAIYHSLYGTF